MSPGKQARGFDRKRQKHMAGTRHWRLVKVATTSFRLSDMEKKEQGQVACLSCCLFS